MPDRKFGRISPEILPHDDPTVHHFSLKAKPKLKPPPLQANWSKSTVYGMHLNDRLGSCGPASAANATQDFTSWTQPAPTLIDDRELLAIYEAVGKYNPRNPASDQGVILKDLFEYWKDRGIGGYKIIDYFSVDPQNMVNQSWAIDIFGGLIYGVNLPKSALDAMDTGGSSHTWDYVPQSQIEGGHAIWCNGYDPQGRKIRSWTELVDMTGAFIQHEAEEVWGIIHPAWFDPKTGLCPNGLSLQSALVDAVLI